MYEWYKKLNRYCGELINDLKYGYGEEYFPEGEIYKGEYKNGQPNG